MAESQAKHPVTSKKVLPSHMEGDRQDFTSTGMILS